MKRLECLDGLRGVLAVYVLLGHMAPFAPLPDWLQHAVSHGGAAVDVFFALSGLVISQSLLHAGGHAKPFLITRTARIFPVFLLVFAFAVAVQSWPCGFEHMPWIGPDSVARTICVTAWPNTWMPEILAHLTMTHGLFPNGMLPDVWVSFLGSAWSLSTEWQFYLVALLATSQSQRLCWLLLGLGAAAAAWRLNVPDAWQFSRAFLANKGHFFALGMASVPLVRQERGALRRYAWILAGCLAICATEGAIAKMLPPVVWTICLIAQLRPGDPGNTGPIRQILYTGTGGPVVTKPGGTVFGGNFICLYLVNEPIHKLAGGALSWVASGDAALFTLLWIPVAIGLPLLAADWLHTHVERPALRLGRSIARERAVFKTAPSVQGRGRGL